MSLHFRISIVIAIFILLTGCVNELSPENSGTSSANIVEAYPQPSKDHIDLYPSNSTYPGPEQSFSTEQTKDFIIPMPNEDLGIVIGKLMTPNANGKPYINPLYLSKTVEASQEGFPPIVAFSEETDPQSIQDSTGQFIFTDITPGKYALILWSPVGSFPIQDMNKQGEYLTFEVAAGVITDLGVISIP